MVPFVSFLALAGNTIAISSDTDMEILASTLAVIEPVAENSPAARSLYHVCQKFYQITKILTSDKQNTIFKSSSEGQNFVDMPSVILDDSYELTAQVDVADCTYPMSQQDWDDVMKDFQIGLDDVNAGEMASFIEPYM